MRGSFWRARVAVGGLRWWQRLLHLLRNIAIQVHASNTERILLLLQPCDPHAVIDTNRFFHEQVGRSGNNTRRQHRKELKFWGGGSTHLLAPKFRKK